jgi:hypothetical protein
MKTKTRDITVLQCVEYCSLEASSIEGGFTMSINQGHEGHCTMCNFLLHKCLREEYGLSFSGLFFFLVVLTRLINRQVSKSYFFLTLSKDPQKGEG